MKQSHYRILLFLGLAIICFWSYLFLYVQPYSVWEYLILLAGGVLAYYGYHNLDEFDLDSED